MFFRVIAAGPFRRWTNVVEQPGALFECTEKEGEIMRDALEIGYRVQEVSEEEARAEIAAKLAAVEAAAESKVEEPVEEPEPEYQTRPTTPAAEKPPVDTSSLGDA